MAERQVDVAIIRAGTAGLAPYRRARDHTDRLVLIEGGRRHGTTCARVGCMPSKLLIAAAEAAHAVREAPVFGIEAGGAPRVDGRAVMNCVRALRDHFVGSVLEVVEDFPAKHRLAGHARFKGDHHLQVGSARCRNGRGIEREIGGGAGCCSSRRLRPGGPGGGVARVPDR